MKFICKTHGVVEAEPNANLDVWCPECEREWLEDLKRHQNADFVNVHLPASFSCAFDPTNLEDALQKAEDKVVSRLDDVEGMLEHQVINWLGRDAPISALAVLVNHYRYTEMLVQEIAELRKQSDGRLDAAMHNTAVGVGERERANEAEAVLESESAEKFVEYLHQQGSSVPVVDYGFYGRRRETLTDALARFKLHACNVRVNGED